jgi:hypothetical protein
MGWDNDQVRLFVKDVRKACGDGWSLLGARLQRALLAEKALQVVVMQHGETVKTDDVQQLYADMERAVFPEQYREEPEPEPVRSEAGGENGEQQSADLRPGCFNCGSGKTSRGGDCPYCFGGRLSVDYIRALRRYAATAGRTWKNRLRRDWEAGRDLGQELQHIRTIVGPSGLDRVRL